MTRTDGDVIGRLEQTIDRLADGSAPLEELVAAYQRALELVGEAEKELEDLRARAAELTESVIA